MKFCALDALRGICALVVVIYHIEVIGVIYAGQMHGVPFFEHGFLFVDFFFVLSGFVLTHTYFSKITNTNDLLVFIIRRFGRVYPLHLFFLALFIGLELIKLYAYADGIHTNNEPFHGSFSVASIFTNIFLVQALNIHSETTWNSPSWSISVEFYTYVIFAVCAILLRYRKIAFIVCSVIISAFGAFIVYKFSKDYINTVYDYAIFRCLFGFFCGALTYFASAKVRNMFVGPDWLFFGVEAATSFGCIVFVSCTGATPQSLAAPLVFAVAVTVFSLEKGWISSLLATKPFQFLGSISYTLYISHAFILIMLARIFRVLKQKTPYILSIKYHHRSIDLMLPVSYAFSNFAVVGILASSVLLSVAVNRWLEIPCRNYFNRASERFYRRRNPPHSALPNVEPTTADVTGATKQW